MDCVTAMARLLDAPAAFLKTYPVKSAGVSAPVQNAANFRQYYLDKLSGKNVVDPVTHKTIKVVPEGHRGATRPGLFGYQRQISSFKLSQHQSAGSGTVAQAHIVPMVNFNSAIYGCPNLLGNVTAMPYYLLNGAGDGLMVTGELSNCCFCWIVQGADLWCIHVQPVGQMANGDTISPIGLQNMLALQGRFGAAPGASLHTYGRNDYPGRASVIGVRKGGAWSLYAQESPTSSFDSISGAYRIYPTPAERL